MRNVTYALYPHLLSVLVPGAMRAMGTATQRREFYISFVKTRIIEICNESHFFFAEYGLDL